MVQQWFEGPWEGTVLEERAKSFLFVLFFFFLRWKYFLWQSRLFSAAHTSSPMRVTLADKNVCNTNTIGFGQECRSMVCGRKDIIIKTIYRHFFYFNFFGGTGFELRTSHLPSTLPLEPLCQPFSCSGYFWDRVLQTICLGWTQTTILLISAFWVDVLFKKNLDVLGV
jgi:hypothetical protein